MDNPDGYYNICLEELKEEEEISIVNYPMEGRSFIAKLIYLFSVSLCYRTKNSVFAQKLQRSLFPYYYKQLPKNEKDYCFVFISDVWNIEFIRFLKDRYKNCKIVMALRDLVRTKWFFEELRSSNLVDLWMSYDKGDCEKHNMIYFSEFESKIYVPSNLQIQSSDIFFIGRAKNRLSKLIKCYDYLTSLGKKCLFIILNASEVDKQERDGIVYSNTPITYRRILEYSINSKCLLDINQEGATGFTSRFLESVIYNKLLLTDNRTVLEHSAYNPKFIKVFNEINEVTADFFDNDSNVSYNYNNEFSPIHFIETINNHI